MDKWCEVLIWRKYPECKPQKEVAYLCKYNDTNKTRNIAYWQKGYWYEPTDDYSDIDVSDFVISFADLPTGSIGDEFGFETALLLQRTNLISSVSKRLLAIVDDDVMWYKCHDEPIRESDGEVCGIIQAWEWEKTEFTFAEILGKWRRA
jgi:hypothetical protein